MSKKWLVFLALAFLGWAAFIDLCISLILSPA